MRAVGDKPIVFVVDDDQDYRDSLEALFNSVDLKVKLFGSATELLGRELPDVVNCLVVDVRLPELSGLDFQAELSKANISIPVIFMTGYGDVPMSVKAMKAGAVDFLSKPFRDRDMLDAVTIALDRDRKWRNAERRLADLRSRLEGLSQREREVMALVTTGRSQPAHLSLCCLHAKVISSLVALVGETRGGCHDDHHLRARCAARLGVRAVPPVRRYVATSGPRLLRLSMQPLVRPIAEGSL